MKSKWMVSENIAGGEPLYGVYRLRNADEADCSGNRETFAGLFEDRAAAERLAMEKNMEDEDNRNRD